jgi:hypothetical protein
MYNSITILISFAINVRALPTTKDLANRFVTLED